MIQEELLNRLNKAMNTISKHPKTATGISFLFEEFVASVEEITHDLLEGSDEVVANNLREIVKLLEDPYLPEDYLGVDKSFSPETPDLQKEHADSQNRRASVLTIK